MAGTFNLVESWLAVVLTDPGMTPAQAVRDMNNELKTTYPVHRIYEWRQGDRSIPEPVREHMMIVALPYVLQEALGASVMPDISRRQLSKLAAMLLPPDRGD